MKNEKVIPIVFSTDKNYLAPCYITLYSAIQNMVEGTKYIFYILIPDSIKPEDLKCFQRLDEQNKSIEIKFCPVFEKDFQVCLSGNEVVSHITQTTYYRFLIPNLLKEHNKCLYIDVDTVIQRDLKEVFEIDLGGNYIAGVRNVFGDCLPGTERYRERCNELGIDSLKAYVNAGVLVMNLERLRADGIQDKWMKLSAEKTFLYNDQDVINSVCYGKIKLISYQYNVFPDYCRDLTAAFSLLQEDYESAANAPVIVHYVSKEKPWISRYYYMADLWWKYYDEIGKDIKKEFLDSFVRKSKKKISKIQHLKMWVKELRFVKMILKR